MTQVLGPPHYALGVVCEMRGWTQWRLWQLPSRSFKAPSSAVGAQEGMLEARPGLPALTPRGLALGPFSVEAGCGEGHLSARCPPRANTGTVALEWGREARWD